MSKQEIENRQRKERWESRSYNSLTLLVAIPTLLIVIVGFLYLLFTLASEGDWFSLIIVSLMVTVGVAKFINFLLGEINRSAKYVFVNSSDEGQKGRLLSINELSQELGENPSTIRQWCQNLNIKSKYLNVEQAERIRNYGIAIREGLEVK
jgi:hypothetical protein